MKAEESPRLSADASRKSSIFGKRMSQQESMGTRLGSHLQNVGLDAEYGQVNKSPSLVRPVSEKLDET